MRALAFVVSGGEKFRDMSIVRHLTTEELESGLHEICRAPRSGGTLAMIVRRPRIGEREVMPEAELDLAGGLVGDNWKARGSRSMPDGSAHPEMQLNVMNARVVALLAQTRERWALAAVNLEQLAKATPGYSGADLANLLNEGAIHAARNRRPTVTMADLDEARDKINWGRETRRVMTDHDKKVIAYHEAGHALMQVLSGEDAMKLQRVTIIPRGRSLGSTHFAPERDLFNYSRELLIARLRCLMAGRVAEELALGTITSGASGDIQEATRTARQMIFEFGMSPLGFMALSRSDDGEPLASPQTFHEAERHLKALLDDNYEATTRALRENRAALDAIAEELIARETVSGDEVRAIAARLRSTSV